VPHHPAHLPCRSSGRALKPTQLLQAHEVWLRNGVCESTLSQQNGHTAGVYSHAADDTVSCAAARAVAALRPEDADQHAGVCSTGNTACMHVRALDSAVKGSTVECSALAGSKLLDAAGMYHLFLIDSHFGGGDLSWLTQGSKQGAVGVGRSGWVWLPPKSLGHSEAVGLVLADVLGALGLLAGDTLRGALQLPISAASEVTAVFSLASESGHEVSSWQFAPWHEVRWPQAPWSTLSLVQPLTVPVLSGLVARKRAMNLPTVTQKYPVLVHNSGTHEQMANSEVRSACIL
jgi:hypothetical protein